MRKRSLRRQKRAALRFNRHGGAAYGNGRKSPDGRRDTARAKLRSCGGGGEATERIMAWSRRLEQERHGPCVHVVVGAHFLFSNSPHAHDVVCPATDAACLLRGLCVLAAIGDDSHSASQMQ